MKKFLKRLAIYVLFALVLLFVGKNRLDHMYAAEQAKANAQSEKDPKWIDVEKIANEDRVSRVSESEIFFLLTGVDDNPTKEDTVNTRTDTIMLVKVDFQHPSIQLVSLPRDSYVSVKGKMTKLNHAYAYGGMDLTFKTIRKWLGIDLDYYVEVDFDAVRRIVDAIGGIEYEIPDNGIKYEVFYEEGGSEVFQPGKQRLNGKQALAFLRFRHGYKEGDIGRVHAQQNFLKSFVDQALTGANIGSLPGIVQTILTDVHTNIPWSDIVGMLGQIPGLKGAKLQTDTIPGDGEYKDGVSYYMTDPQKTKDMIKKYFPNYLLRHSDGEEAEDQSGENSSQEESGSQRRQE